MITSTHAPRLDLPHAAANERPAATRPRRGTRACGGFTLIELMIGVAIVGVLSSLALPSFEGPLQRARRTDVLVSMMLIQAAQERFRGNANTYGSLAEIGVTATSSAGHYLLRVSASGADGYDVHATATGAQARDTACRHMKLSAVGLNLVYASGADSSATNPAPINRKCWNL
ncbi:MAG: prepilin-type N-terminal cleavage/methylation domain-containing protein [Burkholderiales bacterium]|nr:prepilin-type N-terminal cleavage/methylation domain-containing protein [Burkholderiales bacterium]MDE2300021.1 prepilin-type N-terminal cleavage/methylation domain-containing protein [Burkholderiales bacterium]MDE2627451.1 prepilin-type N-terminal cleavage/methylation domain-containing protein [Burkholderiales bacterium]